MDDTIEKTTSQESEDVSESLRKLRDPIFKSWELSVRSTIPESKRIEEKNLKTCLKFFFDELINSLRQSRPYSSEISGVDVGSPHGRQRANATGYGPKEVLKEFQLFRQVVFEVASAHNLMLQPKHRSIIGRSIENAALEAVNGFAIAQKEIGETFIASLSHDLRNPLNVASVSAQLIEHNTTDEKILGLAQRTRKKLSEIDAMIQTLLDAALIKGRRRLRLRIFFFDMKALADDVASEMSSPEHPIICVGNSTSGYWCPAAIKRVFENLLSNAQKYGACNSTITLRIAKLDETVMITVHNEGPPIPENDRHLLFSTFHRFEDIKVKGWGLGLPFVRLVTESHHGSISVESEKDSGTIFKITLPVDCRAYGEPAPV